MKPSEMETILGFFIIYHSGEDIEGTEDYLSQKYKLAESKAKRLKIEFANRYRKNSNMGEAIAGIVVGLFEENKTPFEYNVAGKCVSFKSPFLMRRKNAVGYYSLLQFTILLPAPTLVNIVK